MSALRLVSDHEAADHRVLTCACGKVTTFRCHELWPHEGLVPCSEPLCSPTCALHRHTVGSMGFPAWTAGSADYMGDSPDGPGFIYWLASVCRTLFWSKQRKAQYVWDGMRRKIPPPAPLPPFILRFGSTSFGAIGDVMKELE